MNLIKETYNGQWIIDGTGVYTWKSGDMYNGQWNHDIKNGKGVHFTHQILIVS